MKYLFYLLVAASVLLQGFSKTFLVLNYEMNKNSIAEKYCVNKNKPQIHCQGKCHLVKQMKEEDEKESLPQSRTEKYEVQLFLESEEYSIAFLPASLRLFTSYKEKKTITQVFSVFHPPRLAA